MSLFINDEDEDKLELIPFFKRRKLKTDLEDLSNFNDDQNDMDDLNDLSDSDWEEVDLDFMSSAHTGSTEQFTIELNSQKQKILQLIQEKKQRVTLHYLSMISYVLHARFRNTLMIDEKVLKTIRKLLPSSIKKIHKKFRKNDGDEQLLVYLLKYLVKWFRKNFKHDSNGIRVLGYKRSHGEYPNNAACISNVRDLISVIKKFQHNRDTGAQIFTALLRSLGFQARLVFSLPLLPTNKNVKSQPKLNHEILKVNKDNDLLYPYFWTEVVNPLNSSELFIMETQCFFEEEKHLIKVKRFNSKKNINTSQFYPISNQLCQMSMHYVLAFDNNNLILDVSSRYMRNIAYRYFKSLDLRTESGRSTYVLQSLIRILNKQKLYTNEDNMELSTLLYSALNNFEVPKNVSAMKKNPNCVAKSTLRYNEVISSEAEPIGFVQLYNRKEAVYFKDSVVTGKSERQWKFVGRSIKPDENPLKMVKASPHTINNKRVFKQNEIENPALNQVELYSFNQTCAFIKEKVENGSIPRNKYGNIEIFRENMIPEECLWLRLSNIETILKNKFEFVPVVVGFLFKDNKALPKKQGVVILKKDEMEVKKFWLNERIKQSRLENLLEKAHFLHTWKKLIQKLRIREDLHKRYGHL